MKTDLSIIIPVLNESDTINQTIDKIYEQNFTGCLEIIVVDGSRELTTIQNIKNKKVRIAACAQGRGRQMNCGAKMADARIFLFLHSDTYLPQNALNDITRVMEDPLIKAGAFDLSIQKKGLFFRIIEKTASFRSRLTRIPYGDQAVFIRQKYFFDIGQYKEIPIMEDVDLMRRIKKDKGKIKILNTRTATSSRRWEKEGRVFCTLRNWTILVLFFLGVKPEKLAQVYKIKDNK